MIKVVKFGEAPWQARSSSGKVRDILLADKKRRYVVPSAPGKRHKNDTKVTDMLYECYALAEAGEEFKPLLRKIRARYNEIINGLKINLNLDDKFKEIEGQFAQKAGGDYAASRGEYLNGIIMSHFIGYEFIDAAEVIRFDKDGNFDADTTNDILKQRLKK